MSKHYSLDLVQGEIEELCYITQVEAYALLLVYWFDPQIEGRMICSNISGP